MMAAEVDKGEYSFGAAFWLVNVVIVVEVVIVDFVVLLLLFAEFFFSKRRRDERIPKIGVRSAGWCSIRDNTTRIGNGSSDDDVIDCIER